MLGIHYWDIVSDEGEYDFSLGVWLLVREGKLVGRRSPLGGSQESLIICNILAVSHILE